MSEFEPFLSPDKPIRQGDIFAWGDWASREDWEKFGVIITADCDIANNRASSFLAYLPILSLESYVKLVWARERISRLFRTHERQTADEIHRLHLRLNPNATKLDALTLQHWIPVAQNAPNRSENLLNRLQIHHPINYSAGKS
jgi:hypothetical protein